MNEGDTNPSGTNRSEALSSVSSAMLKMTYICSWNVLYMNSTAINVMPTHIEGPCPNLQHLPSRDRCKCVYVMSAEGNIRETAANIYREQSQVVLQEVEPCGQGIKGKSVYCKTCSVSSVCMVSMSEL